MCKKVDQIRFWLHVKCKIIPAYTGYLVSSLVSLFNQRPQKFKTPHFLHEFSLGFYWFILLINYTKKYTNSKQFLHEKMKLAFASNSSDRKSDTELFDTIYWFIDNCGYHSISNNTSFENLSKVLQKLTLCELVSPLFWPQYWVEVWWL